MILQGNQRGGSTDLANHLLKEENDHVEVHELRGFIADDLKGALREAHAISKATKAKQFMFSLSLNPPPTEHVSTADFEDAINQVEDKLGLTGQPRAIVFHEKKCRRHCHTVWSRTDIKNMKAIQLSHTKNKLMEVSRALYIKHGWQMPRGMINHAARDPHNFTLAQWQQAKRLGKNPKAIKRTLQTCWAVSDNRDSFASALQEHGYILAKGDRRGFVVLNQQCEVFAVAKWVGIKTKDVKAKLADTQGLPSVEDAKSVITDTMQTHLTQLRDAHNKAVQKRQLAIEASRQAMVAQHIQAREALQLAQDTRKAEEKRIRQQRYRKGLRGLLDRVSGRTRKVTRYNQQEILFNLERDRKEKDALIFEQLESRQRLERRYQRLEQFNSQTTQTISSDIDEFKKVASLKDAYFDFKSQKQQKSAPANQHKPPRHTL